MHDKVRIKLAYYILQAISNRCNYFQPQQWASPMTQREIRLACEVWKLNNSGDITVQWLQALVAWQMSDHVTKSPQVSVKKTPWSESANKLYRPSGRCLSAKLVPTFAGYKLSRGQRYGSLRPYSWFSRSEPLLFLPSSSSIVFTRLSGPRSRPILLRKSGSAVNRTRTSGSVARNSGVGIRLLVWLQ
jgi:hypothetical protein